MDVDRGANVDFDTFLTKDTRLVIPTQHGFGVSSSFQGFEFTQDFMATAPRNPLFRDALRHVLAQHRACHSRCGGCGAGTDNVLCTTLDWGPGAWFRAVTQRLWGAALVPPHFNSSLMHGLRGTPTMLRINEMTRNMTTRHIVTAMEDGQFRTITHELRPNGTLLGVKLPPQASQSWSEPLHRASLKYQQAKRKLYHAAHTVAWQVSPPGSRAAKPDAAKRAAVPPSGIKRAAAAGSAESASLAVSFTPANVSSKPTTDWKEGVCWLSSSTQGNACEADDRAGTFPDAVDDSEACRQRCLQCAQCVYISYSKRDRDCSWSVRCPYLRSMGTAHRTLAVRSEPSARAQSMLRNADAYVRLAARAAAATAPPPARAAAEGGLGIVSYFVAGDRASEASVVLGSIALRSHAAYAARHGYQHMTTSSCLRSKDELDSVRPATWAKVFLLRACFMRHEAIDHLVWFDSDVVIANYTLSMETILAQTATQSCALVLGSDEKELGCPFNTGLMLLRRSNTTDRVLTALAKLYDDPRARHAINPEQTALTRMYKSYMWVRRALCVVPRRPLLQSFMKFEEQHAGDFSLHFTLSPLKQLDEFAATVRRQAGRVPAPSTQGGWSASPPADGESV